MPDKTMSKRDRIIEFIKVGLSDIEIAEIVKISASSGYIRRVRRSLSDNAGQSTPGQSTPKLTPERYYNAMKQNDGTKEELAAALGISRMGLHKFEQNTEMKKRLAEYLYMRGMSVEEIAAQIGAKITALEEMGLKELPTIPNLKKQFERVLLRYEDAATWDTEIAAEYYKLKSAYDKLK